MNLRPYQSEALNLLKERFREGKKRVILCLPTGAGKTVSFASLTKATIEKDPRARVLILTDRVELLSQAGGTLERMGIQAGLLTAQSKYMPSERVVVAMVETYAKRIKKKWAVPNLKLIIVDEAHKAAFRKVIQHTTAHVIGATATPVCASKKHPLKSYFDDIVSNIDIAALVEAGYLAKPRYFATDITVTAAVSKSTGDFDEAQLFQQFDKPELYAGVVSNYALHANGKKALVFCVNMEHAEKTCMAFKQAGYASDYITSEMDMRHRKQVLHWFSSTPGAVLVNCGILTTGFDQPDIECVILNRATTSLPLYLQMCGRGSRRTPVKNTFTVLDMGDNIRRLDFWCEPRDWVQAFLSPEKEGKKKPAPMKSCPKCFALLNVKVMTCPCCGFEFPREEKELVPTVTTEIRPPSRITAKPDEELLREKNENLTVDELVRKVRLMKKPDGTPFHKYWVAHKLLERPDPVPLLIRFAVLNKYKYPAQWAHHFIRNNK